MKKLKLILLLSFIPIYICCSNDTDDTDAATSENYIENNCPLNEGTCCGTNGRFKVMAGKTYIYSVNTTIPNPSITWEIDSGLIELISTNGNEAIFKFNSNFTQGAIRSKTTGSSEYCEDVLIISKL